MQSKKVCLNIREIGCTFVQGKNTIILKIPLQGKTEG